MRINQLYEDTESNSIIAPLYHSSNSLIPDGTLVPFRLRDMPRDTSLKIHDAVNTLTVEKFGVPVRNLLFTYRNKDKSEGYGAHIYEIIPNGNNFKFYYAEYVDDFTDHSRDAFEKMDIGAYFNKMHPDAELEMRDQALYLDLAVKRALNGEREFVGKKVLQFLETGGLSKYIDSVFEIAELVAKDIALEYVDRIIEVKNQDDLKGVHDEVMVYAPDGFYTKRISHE